MQNKDFFKVVTVIFSLVFLLHLLRIVLGWWVYIGGWVVPTWASWIAVILAGWLAFEGFKRIKKGE